MQVLGGLANAELLIRVRTMAARERRLLADLLEHLIEIDRRRLYAEGYSSLFSFLTGELKYSESAAGRRVGAVRLCARVPLVLEAMRDGRLTLAGVGVLAAVLSVENAAEVLRKAEFQTTRQLEELAVQYQPKPVVKESIRVEGKKKAAAVMFVEQGRSEDPAPVRPKKDEVKPCQEEVYNIKFSAKKGFVARLERAKELLSHSLPGGKLEDVLDKALSFYLEKHDPLLKAERKTKRRHSQGLRPAVEESRHPQDRRSVRGSLAQQESGEIPDAAAQLGMTEGAAGQIEVAHGRYIPKAIQREVCHRDKSQCTHVDPGTGRRCGERRFLHVDHVVPFAKGGGSQEAQNLRLLCSTHNALYARRQFGAEFMRQKIVERSAAFFSTAAGAAGDRMVME